MKPFNPKYNRSVFSDFVNLFFKIIFFLFFQLTVIWAKADNYYLSNAGNDENDGRFPSTAWKTLAKVNSFKNFKPGDHILLKKGDTFYGNINLANTSWPSVNNGTEGNPITFSSFGTGEKPMITGFTNVNNWINLGGNIWESNSAISELSACNLVTINGVNTPMGRYPNSGWGKIESATQKSITDNSLAGKDFTGGEVVTRVERPVIERYQLTSQSGNTIRFNTENDGYGPKQGWGYFIQNHPATLDTLNEWYFNPVTKKLRIYSTVEPKNVKATTIDTLITILATHFLTFDGLNFEGANKNIFVIGSSKHITIQNCAFNYAGENTIWGKNFWKDIDSDSLKIMNNTFRNTNNYAIFLENEKKNAYIGHNLFDSTALIEGSLTAGDAKGIPIMSIGNSSLIEYNTITNCGYTAIFFQGNGTIVKNNLIDSFCLLKDDGGGIYTWTPNVENAFHGMRISDNVILNGIGNIEGVDDGSLEVWTDGIYLDIRSSFVEVSGNTVAKCNRAGIFPYRGQGNYIHHNLCYDNKFGIRFQDDLGTVINDTIKHNVFISKYEDQLPGEFYAPYNNISTFGIIDSNYYAKPIDSNFVIGVTTGTGSDYRKEILTLANWQDRYKFDVHSKQSPASIKQFTYVAGQANKFANGAFNSNIDGSALWSANNNLVTSWNNNNKIDGGSLQVAYNHASPGVTMPNVNFDVGSINPEKNYVLKFSSIGNLDNKTLYASLRNLQANWEDLAEVVPTIISTSRTDNEILFNFPKGVSSGAITLTWNDLDLNDKFWIDNVELFEANVSENNIDDFIFFKYNASTSNITFSLPGNFMDVTGKLYSGNVTLAPFTSIVLIKDRNQGEKKPPITDAGTPQTISLPTDKVDLSGSGSSLTSNKLNYKWVKVSGPQADVIANPASAITSVTNLSEGTFVYELTVTDEDGLFGKDTTQVKVVAAPNIPPIANAGGNKSIQLPVNKITLSGSGTDADGTVVSYLWTKISGPTAFSIVNAASAVTDVSGLVQGIYQFELKVTDNSGAVAKDIMQVIVNSAANIPPVANAGGNKSIQLPVNKITLSGSGSDADGTVVSYLWTKVSGPTSFNIVNAASAVTDVTGLVQGTYQFELKVTDNIGAVAKDTMQVIVNPAANIPPIAKAGPAQAITLPLYYVNLSGSGTDVDGSVVSYLWTKISGPISFSIVNAASPVTDVTGLIQGTYEFELKVMDNNGAVGKDTMQVIVNKAANIPPVANAGMDIIVIFPVNSVILNGSGTDADGFVVSYLWKQISGPSESLINKSNSSSANISNLMGGNYIFELTVTDNEGATGKDTMIVSFDFGRMASVVNSINVYPNPVKDIATLEISTIKANGTDLLIIVSDINGKIVYRKTKKIDQAIFNEKVDMTGFAKGVYTMAVYFDEKEKQTLKIVKL